MSRCDVNDLIESLFKAVGQVVVELLFKLPGILITKWFRLESDSNPDGCFVILVGLFFWSLVGGCIWFIVSRV